MKELNLDEPIFYTPGEVARIFRVDPKTVGRWAIKGKISSVKLHNGHRRYYIEEINKLIEDRTTKRKENNSE